MDKLGGQATPKPQRSAVPEAAEHLSELGRWKSPSLLFDLRVPATLLNLCTAQRCLRVMLISGVWREIRKGRILLN